MHHHLEASVDFVSVIASALIASSASFIGPWALRQIDLAYEKKVEVLPPFPIILKPYNWIVLLYLTGGMMLLTAIVFVAWMILIMSSGTGLWIDRKWFDVLDLPSIILFALVVVLVYLFAARRIVIEADKLTYHAWGRNKVLDFHDIANHKITRGYLIVERKSDGSTISIPFDFHNICYLNETLKRWFSQLGQRHHFVYPS